MVIPAPVWIRVLAEFSSSERAQIERWSLPCLPIVVVVDERQIRPYSLRDRFIQAVESDPTVAAQERVQRHRLAHRED